MVYPSHCTMRGAELQEVGERFLGDCKFQFVMVASRPPGDWCGTHWDDRYVSGRPSRHLPTNRPAVGWLPCLGNVVALRQPAPQRGAATSLLCATVGGGFVVWATFTGGSAALHPRLPCVSPLAAKWLPSPVEKTTTNDGHPPAFTRLCSPCIFPILR